jgi:hypothetical protein
MFRDEYIVQISEYLLARCSKDSLILNNAPKLQLYPSLQYHTSSYPFPMSMNFLFSLSFNPLSLMNPSRLFRNFVFLFSLVGLGSFAWGERYETIHVYSEDTAPMTHEAGVAYLKSSSLLSAQTLQIPQGEIAYVFSVGANSKPTGTLDYERSISTATINYISVSMSGLDSNISLGNWFPENVNWNTTSNSTPPGNLIPTSLGPISGPCSVKIYLKPTSGRQLSSNSPAYWKRSDFQNWDFKASEGFVTFRIVGTEQAPSKKFATVIPENASGNVRIVLEQSTDLINWSSANPGVFSPSTSKRFFRVRSVEE